MGVLSVIVLVFLLLSCTAEVSNSDLDESSSEQESSSQQTSSNKSEPSSSLVAESSSVDLSVSSSDGESSIEVEVSSSSIESSESSSALLSSESSSSSVPVLSNPEWETNGSIYTITHNDHTIEIDASIGGRVIEFALSGENILMYGDDDKGSIFWLSPQSDWNWPPSAEIDDSTYSVELSDDNTLLTLTSGVDSISGMTVEKQFSFNAAHDRVDIIYTIINTSDSVQEVAPWANSRCNPKGLTFFPLGDFTNVKAPSFDTLPIELIDGVGWVDHQDQVKMKAFKDGKEGWLSHYNNGFVFIQAFEDVAVDDFAPGETEIELYVAEEFIEVEYQGAYKELQPGDRYDFNTQWYLASVEGTVVQGSADLVSQVRSILGIE